MNLCSSTRSVLHADRDRERTTVEQAPEQAQSRRGLFQDLRPDRVTASVRLTVMYALIQSWYTYARHNRACFIC